MKFMLIGQEEQSKGEYLDFGPYEDINMAVEGRRFQFNGVGRMRKVQGQRQAKAG